METLEGVTFYNGELCEIVSVTCPSCNYDRLEPVIESYQCLRCGEVFKTNHESY